MTARTIETIGGISIDKFDGESTIFFASGMNIDADGAPKAYHQNDDLALDDLANAGSPGNWWAIATNEGGEPFIQDNDSPAPGYYVSYTALEDKTKENWDQTKYPDASIMPYVVMPGHDLFGEKMGDFCYVVNFANSKSCGAILGDIGPDNEIGEGSIALADLLKIPSDPRTGGIDKDVVYIIFPKTSEGWPVDLDRIQSKASKLFKDWGGFAKLEKAGYSMVNKDQKDQ
jgi:Fungal chitosanase of glycosyl hydrolase group 75